MIIKEIALSETKEGMQLAEDVIDAKGVSLITAGTELSESLINVLKKRGIESVVVYQRQELSDEERENILREMMEQLDIAFSKVQEQPIMQNLKQMIIEYRLREL